MTKGRKVLVLINLISIERTVRAAMKDNNTLRAIIEGSEFSKSALIKSIKSKTDDAKIVGIDIISDKLTLLVREKPRNIAPEIVFPDLDVPGISAKVCHNPIINASLYDHSLFTRFFFPYLSEK